MESCNTQCHSKDPDAKVSLPTTDTRPCVNCSSKGLLSVKEEKVVR